MLMHVSLTAIKIVASIDTIFKHIEGQVCQSYRVFLIANFVDVLIKSLILFKHCNTRISNIFLVILKNPSSFYNSGPHLDLNLPKLDPSFFQFILVF